MFNKVIILGNLAKDIELRYLSNNTPIATSTIASNKKYKAQNGEMKEEVCFIDVTFWSRTAEIANQYLKKGSKILIEGELKLDRWQDQNGQPKSKHSITVSTMQMLDTKGSDKYSQQEDEYSQDPYNQKKQDDSTPRENITQGFSSNKVNNNQNFKSRNTSKIDINEDEIPF